MTPNPIILPTKPMPALRKSPKRLVLYAAPKVGKTTFCSLLPNNLIVDLEDGSELIEALKYQITIKDTTVAQRFAQLNALGRAIEEAGFPYRFITIDTISE
jgi:broad-specificity NMP kinase